MRAGDGAWVIPLPTVARHDRHRIAAFPAGTRPTRTEDIAWGRSVWGDRCAESQIRKVRAAFSVQRIAEELRAGLEVRPAYWNEVM
jgi:hypothetical protein